MKIQQEFSRYADHYGHYNVIQQEVVNKLVCDLQGDEPVQILDLGCGSGTLFSALPFTPRQFVGVDFASRMLELHPKRENVECINGDFNDPKLFDALRRFRFERIFSASALQWSENLEQVFASIAALKSAVSLAIFTGNTFKTLLETAGIESPLPAAEEINALSKKYFNTEVELMRYRLEFENVREMFRYIKRSGVSGNRNILNYRQAKALMQNYPLKYLEFEVAFIRT